MKRLSYPTDVSDEEWAFVAPYLILVREDAPQRDYDLREAFNALRWPLRSGSPWRLLPHDFLPWQAVYQQAQRWLRWGCFEALVHALRVLLHEAHGKKAQPSAAILDGRTVQSTFESGGRAGFDGNKRRKGSKVHFAVDTLGHLLSLVVTPANEQERAQVAQLCQAVQEVAGLSKATTEGWPLTHLQRVTSQHALNYFMNVRRQYREDVKIDLRTVAGELLYKAGLIK